MSGPNPECIHCRYDLSGFGLGDHCPECGRTIHILEPRRFLNAKVRASVVLGVFSLVSLAIGCSGLYFLIYISALSGFLGMILATTGKTEAILNRDEQLTSSISIARTAFWTSAPGVVLGALKLATIVGSWI